jgi:hypothetical protein
MSDPASYRAGLEAAAQWHKAEADRLLAEHERNPAAFPMEWVNHHLSDAAAIRALPVPAAPADDEALVEATVAAVLRAGHPAAQREAVSAALSAARAALVPQWQPIETAPKDGTPILLAPSMYPNRRPVIGAWQQIAVGLFCWVDLENGHHNGFWHPTDWMPLPAAPTQGGGE